MLSPQYTYVAFDFETTGLHVEKDEPIQLGIIFFDSSYRILKERKSLVCPVKPIHELTSIVTHVTGFTLDDLTKAPKRTDIELEVKSLFESFSDGSELVAIGHNIGFDVGMLTKYIPISFAHQIDTFPLSKALIHYSPSYALDVLNGKLEETGNHRKIESGTYHDALVDSYVSYNLCRFLFNEIDRLRKKYMIIDRALQKNCGVLSSLIKRSQKPYTYQDKDLFLPQLGATKYYGTNKRPILAESIDRDAHPQNTFIDGSKSSAREILTKTDFSSGERVIAAGQRSKSGICDSIISGMGWTTETLHDELQIDREMTQKFLKKEAMSDEEVLFLCKYYGQFEAGHALLNINSSYEYKILAAIKKYKKAIKGGIVVCTHQQLYERKENISKDAKILFLDADRWAYTSGEINNQKLDPFHLLNLGEQLEYFLELWKSEHLEEYQSLLQSLLFLIAYNNIEITPFFVGHNEKNVYLDGVVGAGRFPKSSSMHTIVHKKMKQFEQKSLGYPLWIAFKAQLEKFLTFLKEGATVNKRMYSGDNWYYQFSDQSSYIDWSEFQSLLPEAHIYFVTNNSKKHISKRLPRINVPGSSQKILTSLIHQRSKNKVHDLLGRTQGNIFVVSSAKHMSQDLFSFLIGKNIKKNHELVAQNITGGMGKNLHKIKKSQLPGVLIGGVTFYFETVRQGIQIDTIVLYSLHGSSSHQLIYDMIWFSS